MLGGLVKLIALISLVVPLLVLLLFLPNVNSWELFSTPVASTSTGTSADPAPAEKVLVIRTDDVPTPPRPRGVQDTAPPPTLGPPPPTATPVVTAAEDDPEPTAAAPTEQVMIGNTGGIGAAVRDTPQGHQVAGLRDGQVVPVLDRQQVGTTTWIKVHVTDGVDGWILGIVGLPIPASATQTVSPTPRPVP